MFSHIILDTDRNFHLRLNNVIQVEAAVNNGALLQLETTKEDGLEIQHPFIYFLWKLCSSFIVGEQVMLNGNKMAECQ